MLLHIVTTISIFDNTFWYDSLNYVLDHKIKVIYRQCLHFSM